MSETITVTHHAAMRWRERVAEVPYPGAVTAVAAFVAGGKVSGRAPRWAARGHGEGTGVRYATHGAFPGICIVLRNGSALTVLTREAARLYRDFTAEAIATARRKAMA